MKMRDKQDLILRIYRNNFAAFNRFAFAERHPGSEMIDAGHVTLMAERLEACGKERIRRLIINVPPRHLKTHSASIALPVWLLGRNPKAKIMLVTGTQELLADMQEGILRLAQSDRTRHVFPHLNLQPHRMTLRTCYGGALIFGIAGRTLVGRGADMIIVDDPLPPKSAQHAGERDAINNWFDAEVIQRLNNQITGAVIVVMQRLHPMDLTGHLLTGSEIWHHLNLPAIATHDESWKLGDGFTWRRKKGDALNPARESIASLQQRLIDIGAVNFAAQYLQDPGRALQEHLSGTFRLPDKEGAMYFGHVSQRDVLLHEVFGRGKYHPARQPQNLSPEEWVKLYSPTRRAESEEPEAPLRRPQK